MPETHLKVEYGTAIIDPIAGTVHRTGDDEKDAQLARQLLADPKENAEHVMLVDLARNDLSRHANGCGGENIQRGAVLSPCDTHGVTGDGGDYARRQSNPVIFEDFPSGDTFWCAESPGDAFDRRDRTVAARNLRGCIGFIGFDGDMNQAITIRSFLSRNNTLYFQAGAGIVAKSDPEKELDEVNNKLGALDKAIKIANELID